MVAQRFYHKCLAEIELRPENDEAVSDLIDWLGGWPMIDDNAANSSLEAIDGKLALLGYPALIAASVGAMGDRYTFEPADKVKLVVSGRYLNSPVDNTIYLSSTLHLDHFVAQSKSARISWCRRKKERDLRHCLETVL